MDKYRVEKVVGDGTYGEVVRARLASGEGAGAEEVFAIKKMKRKFPSWEECMQLREVKALRRLVHPNIVKLREVIREKDELFLVFEYLDCNMYQLMKERTKPFTERQIKFMMQQILSALAYMHKNGFFHRDCKPENFLVSRPASTSAAEPMYLTKLADYGLAREIRSARNMTEYCSTRWYRAPEVLLRSPQYNSPVDLWAVAAITAELFMLRPLFPGSSESDQIYKTCSIMGTPTIAQWPDGHRLAAVHGIRFPQCSAVPLSSVIRNASPDAIKLLEALLMWDPLKRVGAASALCHPFFAELDRPSSASASSLTRSVIASAPASAMTQITTAPIRDFPALNLLLGPSHADSVTRSRPTNFAAAAAAFQPSPPSLPAVVINFPGRSKQHTLMEAALPRPSDFARGFSGLNPVRPEQPRAGLASMRKPWEAALLAPPPAPAAPAPTTGARSYFGANARNYFL